MWHLFPFDGVPANVEKTANVDGEQIVVVTKVEDTTWSFYNYRKSRGDIVSEKKIGRYIFFTVEDDLDVPVELDGSMSHVMYPTRSRYRVARPDGSIQRP